MTDDRTCVVQFGTSRFLQAHVDLFASEAAAAGQAVPPIVVVQTTRDAGRAARVAAFGAGDGFPVRIRGIAGDGTRVDRETRVRSVVRGIRSAAEWPALCALFESGAAYVVSNTGDAGYRVAAEDRAPRRSPDDEAPRSFPAILLALLQRRWRAGGAPITLLPCELVHRNGDALKAIVIDLARAIYADPAFIAWLDGACLWVNTLVDRIVSAPIEPVGAVAEPYALWAVERQPGLVMPFAHPSVVLTDDLDRYARLKLHILNLGHSWLAQQWIDAGRPAGRSVREAIATPAQRAALDALYAGEVVPGFAAHGLGEAARTYVDETMARFANPYLDHRLADIADHHGEKLHKRVGGFIAWVGSAPVVKRMPQLAALMAQASA